MKTVYILLRHKPNGKTTRPGVWMTRETAERHLKRWQQRASYGADHGSTFEIIEEERLG